jgi:hypothetical protein
VSINIPWKIYYGRQRSCPLGVYIKSIARAFTCMKCLDGFLHLKPTAGCQISTLIFEFFLWREVSMNIPWTIYYGRQRSSPLGFRSKVLPVLLTAWVGFCTSSPQQGVKYQLWYLKLFCGGGVSMNIPWQIC